MKTTALKFALSTTAAAILAVNAFAVDSTSPPVGFVTTSIAGAADNPMSIPMVRDAVFSGTVTGTVNFDNFSVLSGANPPGWSANQFQYVPVTQRLHYYVEITSGQLQGVFYEILSNGTDTLTVDTGGDDLTNRPLDGVGAALQAGDKITIRPFWTIKDVFEVSGVPIIEGRPNAITVKDDILIPDYSFTGTNKPATTTIFYRNDLTGWRATGSGDDFADYVLRPNEAFIVRRRNAAAIPAITSVGAVLMNKAIPFVNGGNGAVGNDTYIALSRPVAVKLDDSGLRSTNQAVTLIKDSPNTIARQDELLEFGAPTAQNQPTAATYFYLAGNGWRKVGDASTTVGQDVFLQPWKAYIVRKKALNGGADWINNANY